MLGGGKSVTLKSSDHRAGQIGISKSTREEIGQESKVKPEEARCNRSCRLRHIVADRAQRMFRVSQRLKGGPLEYCH